MTTTLPEPFFYLRHPDERSISEPREVRELTGQIGVVPGLYPLNHTETVRDAKYLRAHFQGRRSSQHARNHLLLIKTRRRAGGLQRVRDLMAPGD